MPYPHREEVPDLGGRSLRCHKFGRLVGHGVRADSVWPTSAPGLSALLVQRFLLPGGVLVGVAMVMGPLFTNSGKRALLVGCEH